jgi:polyisoprenoid-binding protein YceI
LKKVLLKIIYFVIILCIGIWIGNQGIKMLWGKAESNLVTSSIKEGNSNIEELSGNYKSEEGFNITSSEIMFTIEGDIELTVGKFKQFDINLQMNDKLSKSKITVVIDANSIFSDNKKRDDHLSGDDFFNTEKYPEITFKSESIKLSGISEECYNYISNGTLYMLGTQKDINIKFNYIGSGKNLNNQDIAIFEGSLSFDRTEYGMSETESVGNQVKINFYTELIKQEGELINEDSEESLEKDEEDDFDF